MAPSCTSWCCTGSVNGLHDLLGEPAEFHGFVPQWAPLFWELSGHECR
jgi:hypothetical protein